MEDTELSVKEKYELKVKALIRIQEILTKKGLGIDVSNTERWADSQEAEGAFKTCLEIANDCIEENCKEDLYYFLEDLEFNPCSIELIVGKENMQLIGSSIH